jgi:hypothetical protein
MTFVLFLPIRPVKKISSLFMIVTFVDPPDDDPPFSLIYHSTSAEPVWVVVIL